MTKPATPPVAPANSVVLMYEEFASNYGSEIFCSEGDFGLAAFAAGMTACAAMAQIDLDRLIDLTNGRIVGAQIDQILIDKAQLQ